MKKAWVISILVAVLLIAGCSSKQESTTPQAPSPSAESKPEAKSTTVEMSDTGFSPSQVTITRGSSVTFVSKGTSNYWPASAVHPTHQVYPGSDIQKCNTPEQSNIFDACRGLKQGESWSFTFNVAGNWKYHDHLNPGLRGGVEVV